MGWTAPCWPRWLSPPSRLRFGGDCQVLPLADPPGLSPSPCCPDKKLALSPTELLVPREPPHRRVPAPFPVSPRPPPSEDPTAPARRWARVRAGSPGWTRATAACPAPSPLPSAMMQTPPALTSVGTGAGAGTCSKAGLRCRQPGTSRLWLLEKFKHRPAASHPHVLARAGLPGCLPPAFRFPLSAGQREWLEERGPDGHL